MQVTLDPEKQADTLRQRGLDFRDAPKVFAGVRFTFEDERFEYPEPRYTTVGLLDGRMVGDRGLDARCRNRRRGMPPDHFHEEG